MIEVWEPRYRDMKVLVARFRIPPAQDFDVLIKKGARKGIYRVRSEVVANSAIETMKTKAGKTIEMRAIPFDKMEAKYETQE